MSLDPSKYLRFTESFIVRIENDSPLLKWFCVRLDVIRAVFL